MKVKSKKIPVVTQPLSRQQVLNRVDRNNTLHCIVPLYLIDLLEAYKLPHEKDDVAFDYLIASFLVGDEEIPISAYECRIVKAKGEKLWVEIKANMIFWLDATDPNKE
jgi:hypothetical protein